MSIRYRDRFWATDEQLYAILDAHDAKVRAGDVDDDDLGGEGDEYYPFRDIDEREDDEK